MIEKNGVLGRQKAWIKSSKSAMKEAKESSEHDVFQERKKLPQRLKDKEFEVEEMKVKNEVFNQKIVKKDEKMELLNVYLGKKGEKRISS